MLPDVDGHKRNEMSSLVAESVLVGGGVELKFLALFIVCEPSPTRSLDSGGVGTEVSDKIIDGSKGLTDGLMERRSLFGKNSSSASNRSEVLPEELVVEVTTSVEFDSLGEVDVLGVIPRLKSTSGLLEESIEIINISLVMLTVVVLHEVLGNDGLEAVDGVRERLENCLLERGEVSHSNAVSEGSGQQGGHHVHFSEHYYLVYLL